MVIGGSKSIGTSIQETQNIRQLQARAISRNLLKKAQFHERTKRRRPFPHPPAATEKVVSHVQRSCLYAGRTVYHP